jgi:hypothetical protein
MAKERKYTVVSPVDFDGKRYDVGAEIVLPDDVAKPLLEVKAISAGKLQLDPPPPPPPPPAT